MIVWIYGGGFEIGTASPPMTDVAALGRATGAVVVAMNYRVGALGWLHLADLGGPNWAGSTNLGLQDQIAALHWVRANIAAFGGDPGNITVAGESAGRVQHRRPARRASRLGTFHRAILSSGSTERVFASATATAIAEDLLAVLGLSSVEELLDVPAERLLAAQGAVTESDIGRRNLPGGRAWGVVLDGSVLSRHPTAAVPGRRRRPPAPARQHQPRRGKAFAIPGFAPADDDACWPTSAGPGSDSPPDCSPPTAPATRAPA